MNTCSGLVTVLEGGVSSAVSASTTDTASTPGRSSRLVSCIMFVGVLLKQCCGSGFNGVPGSGFAIRIRIQESKNGPQFLVKKERKNLSSVFFQFLVIKILDPDPPGFNESGSATLSQRLSGIVSEFFGCV
jgi:hypothetical protein